jgi:hypothetical protein
MTADVKSGAQIILGLQRVVPFGQQKSRGQAETPGEHAALRGVATPFRAAVGGLPHARLEAALRGADRRRGGHHTGAAALPMPAGTFLSERGKGPAVFWPAAVPGSSWAMAHRKPTNARAMATGPPVVWLPGATRRR